MPEQPIPTAPEGVPPKIVDEPTKERGVSEAQGMVNQIVLLVVIVLMIGFAAAFISVVTLWIQSFHDKSASYEDLKTQIVQQNDKIDIITKGLEAQHLLP